MTEQTPDQSGDMPPNRSKHATARTPEGGLSFRVPRLTHVPSATVTAAPVRAPRTRRQKIAASAASVCVAGMALVAILPLAAQVDTGDVAAASVVEPQQQELFSETSAADVPVSFSDVAGEASAEITEASYVFNPKVLVNYPFAQPVMLTDTFGYRTAPVEQFHDAQDFAAGEGTSIQAIADGVITEAGFATDGCGFGLKIEHEIDGLEVTSRYCHMVDGSHTHQVGEDIKMGDFVGKVGATGMAFGAHLHMAIRINDEPAEPMAFLAKYNTMLRDDPARKTSTTSPSTDVTAKVTAATVPAT